MMRQKRDHTDLICSISELAGLFRDSTSLESFLQRIVEMISLHMHSQVCSIYLYSENNKELVLKATTGLNKDFIENVRMKLGEGLTGLALKELRPICERNASKNPHFKYFPGLGEESFETFLAVPINRGSTMIGALVVQNTQRDFFNEDDINALRAISSQLANTIEMTRLILTLEEKPGEEKQPAEQKDLSFIDGKVGSSGVAYAQAVVLKNTQGWDAYLKGHLQSRLTKEDFYQSVKITEKQLEQLQQEIEKKLSDVASLIFTAQILMLKDKAFVDHIVKLIEQGISPAIAIIEVVEDYVRRFKKIDNAYIQERSHDVLDIGKRLLMNLGTEKQEQWEIDNRIVVAEELLPSDALKLSSQNVKGIILLTGGATSHLSILAQSLQIPLIIADVPELMSLPEKSMVLMDAFHGHIYVNPKQEIIDTFEARQQKAKQAAQEVKDKTFTKDSVRVVLLSNVNLLGDLELAKMYKAEGIGLYRTEFPFIVRNDFPSEEEQYVIYRQLIEKMPGQEVTFRTLDIGGDKVLSYFEHHHKEKNPYLGMRSIRFSLKHVDIFSQQLRAILRAGVGRDIRIMFPMISSIDEYMQAKRILTTCVDNLKEESSPCNVNPKVGLMIELPAVLEIIEELAKMADFFSIGTNDFIQYMLAVDRTNEKVSDLYLPHHPAILRALKKIVAAANKHKIDVSVCGDMAHDPKYLPYLLGIGVRKLSVNPTFLPLIQSAINKIDSRKAKKAAQTVLSYGRLRDIMEAMSNADIV